MVPRIPIVRKPPASIISHHEQRHQTFATAAQRLTYRLHGVHFALQFVRFRDATVRRQVADNAFRHVVHQR